MAPDIIAADYELTADRLAPLFAAVGREDEAPRITQILAAKRTTVREAILAACDGWDAEAYLLAAGVDAADLGRVRVRMLG